MPVDIYQGWVDYFQQRPVGWREDNRAFKFLQTQGAKGSPSDYFPAMSPIMQPRTDTQKVERPDSDNISVISTKKFSATSMHFKMLKAKGGKNIWSESE